MQHLPLLLCASCPVGLAFKFLQKLRASNALPLLAHLSFLIYFTVLKCIAYATLQRRFACCTINFYSITDIGFRVYIANILLLLLLLTVSQVRCAYAPVYSNQLIKFELLTQSIRQLRCQSAVDPAVRLALTYCKCRKWSKNICMED